MADSVGLSPTDLDDVARAMVAEAGGDGDQDMTGVAHVIRNRLNSGEFGNSIPDIVFARNQFATGSGTANNNPTFQHARQIAQGVFSGQIPDPTGGAVHFANMSQVTKTQPWMTNPTAKLGGHTFFNPNPDLLGSWPTTSQAPQQSAPQEGPDLLGSWPTQQTDFSSRFAGEPPPPDTTPMTTNIGRGLVKGAVEGAGGILSDVGGAAMTEMGQPNTAPTPEQAASLIQSTATGYIPKATGLVGEASTDIGRMLPYTLTAPGSGVVPWLMRAGVQATTGGLGTTAGREFIGGPYGPMVGGAIGGLTGSGAEAGLTAAGRGAANFFNPSAGAEQTLQKFAGSGNTAVDTSEIVPGSRPTLAEATANPDIARLQRQVRDTNPEPFVQLEKSNEQARKDYWDSATGTQEDIDNAVAKRETDTKQQLGQIFKPGQVADPTPIQKAIDDIRSGASGGRTAVGTVLDRVSKVLDDPRSSDPMYLWKSVRGEIGDLLDKQGDTKAGVQATQQLLDVRDAVDQSITKVAPGFDKFLQSYTESSKPIEAMKYLQGTNIFNPSSNNISLSKVQQAIDRIDKARISGGISPAKSVTDDQYQVLTNIRDDLRRQQNTELGKTKGSPTSQNLATRAQVQALPQAATSILSRHLPEAIGGLVGLGAGHFLPGIGEYLGTAAGGVAGAAISRGLASRNAAFSQELAGRLVNPSPFQSAGIPRSGFRYISPTAVGTLGLLPTPTNRLGQP